MIGLDPANCYKSVCALSKRVCNNELQLSYLHRSEVLSWRPQKVLQSPDMHSASTGLCSGLWRECMYPCLVAAELHACEVIPLDPELHILWYAWRAPAMYGCWKEP